MKKMIWAVDPFATEPSLQANTVKAISGLSRQAHASVEPVHIMSPYQPKLATERAMRALIKSTRLSLKKARFLKGEPESLTASVDSLLKHAKKTGADLIVTATHSQHGLARLFLGSFAETLVLRSRLPVLVVNPTAQVALRIRKILFPTDFSQASRKAFLKLLDFARQSGAEVVLFHKLAPMIVPTTMPLGAPLPYLATLEGKALRESTLKTARAWTDSARKKDVKAEIIIDAKPGNVAAAVVKACAKTDCDLIAMSGQSGIVGATLLGSVARQTIRQATRPVWVLHA